MIGAGISGLLAARVLAEVFERVLVLERDALAEEPAFRPGVPQGRHVHLLMARGRLICEELFPGLSTELEDAGAPLFDMGNTDVLFPRGSARRSPCGIRVLMASRPLLETHIRRRVAALDGVMFHDATRVAGLAFDGSRATVIGVRAARRGPGHTWGEDATIDAALVVDASGRASKLAQWLHAAGMHPPEEVVVDARLCYASRFYAIPEQRQPAPLSLEITYAPHLSRGHVAQRVEGDRLHVTLFGAGGDYPPRDEEGFTAFAASLRSPLKGTLDDLRPASPISQFTRTANRKVAYHGMNDWPAGLIALGDSVCTFNPIYGQGMSVAAMQALALKKTLADPRDLGAARCRRFQRRAARTIGWPWLLATQSDRGWQEDDAAGRVGQAADWYLDQWLGAIPGDRAMFHHYLRVVNLLAGPGSFVRPTAIAGIMRSRSNRAPAGGVQSSAG